MIRIGSSEMIGAVWLDADQAGAEALLEDRDDRAEGGADRQQEAARSAVSGTRIERKAIVSSRNARPTTTARNGISAPPSRSETSMLTAVWPGHEDLGADLALERPARARIVLDEVLGLLRRRPAAGDDAR